MRKILQYIITLPIKAYRLLVSPYISCCKFHPSCSQYALDALNRYGLIKGAWKICCRLIRCNPFSKGGIDPA
ncbi:Putative membrane protein insertion efficiency factor [Candidatus Phycorickettsia trachydisci]|uniref:Putative membrane protein insertion efficiency factor n=1 Tax=Candidatus Phycorickettsia trachydisci TaxID=2115978 RepID=A0A2P1P8G8_9RICK|nr:membrane protein insertion efficiency factor YidD [Candidatus Phycorickettsia trachydisci]AVP87568.1 Putative membrane protein insertion efficiency factor [Candidatus Phycorickettsia trachydisci]